MYQRFSSYALVGLSTALGLGLTIAACSDDTTADSSSAVTTTSSSSGSGAGGSGASGTAVGGATSVGGMGGATSTGTGGVDPGSVDCTDASGMAGQLKLTEIVTGLNKPVLVTAPRGDTDRTFIVEQTGVIQLLNNGQQSVFLDIDNIVGTGGERGLLGVAFHPDYELNGRFFVHYSDNSGDSTLAEYKRSANDPNLADPAPVGSILLRVEQPYGNHNGGSIEFSPADGMLYFGLGDGGSANDPLDSGQTTSSLLGAMLRLDVSSQPYTIPTGNLSTGNLCGQDSNATGPCSEIWDYGLRNPYRFSFDACTADLYVGDVGQNKWEEIDIAAAGDGNKNWGWRLMEGNHCFNPNNDCDPQNLTTLPAAEYSHAGGKCSVTGGYVYRGSSIPWLRGAYLYGDYCTGEVWMLRWKNGQASEPVDLTADLQSKGINISSFGQDARGEMYVIAYSGTVYRIDME